MQPIQQTSGTGSRVTAGELMRTDVVVVSYAAPLSDVERTLVDNRISGAPVVDARGHIVGIVSLRDLVQHYADDPESRPRRDAGFFHLSSEELDEGDYQTIGIPKETEDTAADVMTAAPYWVEVSANLKAIASLMYEHRIHRVLVKQDGKHVGLISTMEVLQALSE